MSDELKSITTFITETIKNQHDTIIKETSISSGSSLGFVSVDHLIICPPVAVNDTVIDQSEFFGHYN